MQNRSVSSQEFERLMEGLSKDLTRASIHLSLYKDLVTSVSKYERVLNNSKTFWSLTFDAHLATSIHCLCRAYDQEASSLHLKSWLETIQGNLGLFGSEQHRKRLAENPSAETLAAHAKKPDKQQLEKDIEAVTLKNKSVKKLIEIRSTGYAHRGYKTTLKQQIQGKDVKLTLEEIEELIDKGIEILNRYSVSFKSLTYSASIIGGDDYMYVLKTLQAGYEAYEEELQTELKRYSNDEEL
ncbi:MAG TPA: hypothetical protein VMM38_15275 [Aridibacter sp.]|nr:hypothetical protein [Aridibacter sp.]